MSNFEGAAGYFVVFGGGPIGAMVGCVLGVLVAINLSRALAKRTRRLNQFDLDR